MDHASRQRYSIASTSATLFIPEEGDEDEEEDEILDTAQQYISKQQYRNANASSSSAYNGLASNNGRGTSSKGKLLENHNSRREHSQSHSMHDESIREGPGIEEDDREIAQGLHEEVEDQDAANTVHDPLDTLIRISSDLLRTSKAILASSKRVNIVNGAIAQTTYTHEHELRRHLESLEQGDRFMSLMSRDAHYILHPTSEEPSLPSPSYARPPQVRLRSRLSDGASNPSRARTMYIHANTGSSGAKEATSPLPTTPICDDPSEQQIEEQVVQEISGLFNQKQAIQPQHTSPKPAVASPTLSSTSSSSPSTFLSSLFSRRSYASTTSSTDSLPAKEGVDTSKKSDAKSLLSALAGTTANCAKPFRTSPARTNTSSQLQKQQSTASFASAAVSDSYTAQIADQSPSSSPSPSPLPDHSTRPTHHRKMSSAALANAQLSAIMADNAHMTLSSRGNKGHTRSSFSLSENLLRASGGMGGGSYTSASPLQQKMEEHERAVGKRKSVNRIGGSQVPKVQISNVPIKAMREGRARELSAPI